MKNTLLALSLAAAGLLAAPLAGHAADQGGAFVNGSVGRASLDKGPFDDDDTGFGANVGYRWAIGDGALIGIEGGYTDLGKYSATVPLDATTDARVRSEIKGWNVGVNGHFNVTPNWYLSGRGGFFRADLRSDVLLPGTGTEPATVGRIDDHDNGWYAGVGFGYDFSNNFSLGLGYDVYRADSHGVDAKPDLASVSAEYRF
jgi:OOP family OmpA-OmpF porin/outer membrane immunogenic protein